MTPAAGLVLLNKPAGITSFQALGAVKRLLGSRQAGHTGTLDRFATGVLAVLTGGLTRLGPLFEALDKSYRATITFGRSTDTLDPEGAVVAEAEVPSRARIEDAIAQLTGWIEQVPPDYSAVHVGGRRAYQLAREGRKPDLIPRRVCIRRIDVLSWFPPQLDVEVHCSKGTYIRSLARDLGLASGSCAFVSRLERRKVGDFRIEEAVAPELFQPERDLIPPSGFLPRLEGVNILALDPRFRESVAQGRPFREEWLLTQGCADGPSAVFDEGQRLLALLSREKTAFRYLAVFPERPA